MAGVGRVGKEARRFVKESGDLVGLARITAEMVISVADVADACRRDGKPRESLAALRELRELLADLRPGGPGGEPGPGDGGADPGGVAGDTDELESLLGSGPSVGDRADA
ncbi:MAG: hypothetical protein CVT66_06225 [Actinobacteria bacterium HGW-Actinobacteria-6]|nr:MAG: hypothetical protein CVT66_06225 [Actinobacteria bacterium HGW-Actinobacteria-6]